MKGETAKILIVGAGPTGLTLASELLRHGVQCRLIDKEPEASPFSKALAIHARTLELLENLGLADRFVDAGWKLTAFNVLDRKRHTVRMTFGELDSRYPYILSLPQSDTERILAEDFTARGGVIERGVTLLDFTQDAESVSARLSHAGGREEKFECEWIAGCGGAHSTTRHVMGVEFQGAKYPEYYVLADVEAETELDVSEFYLFSDGDRLAGFHSFSPTSARIFADIELLESERGHPKVTLEQLQADIDRRGPGNTRLTKLNWLSTFFVHKRLVRHYQVERAFLAGDAAHVHSPASGQGMNMGMQDAFNLAWKLALVARGESPPSLLKSYGPERRHVARKILQMTDFFQRLNTIHQPVLQYIRGTLGPWLSRLEKVRHRYRRAVAGLSQSYPKSAVVTEGTLLGGFRRGPKAGERAQDGMLFDRRENNDVRLFDLIRAPRHHLLLFAGQDAAAKEIEAFIRGKYANQITPLIISASETKEAELVDKDFSLHQCYGAPPSMLYLIRPDGYVGYRGDANREKLEGYLKQIFY